MKIPSGAWIALLVCVIGGTALAQERRIASPAGRSATQVGGTYDERAGYAGGRWIEIRYGRPIKRGRDLFGPADYREFLNDGAPVWRAGANQSTQLLTELPLVFDDQAIPAGEYTVFIDLRPTPGRSSSPPGRRSRNTTTRTRRRCSARTTTRRTRMSCGRRCGARRRPTPTTSSPGSSST